VKATKGSLAGFQALPKPCVDKHEKSEAGYWKLGSSTRKGLHCADSMPASGISRLAHDLANDCKRPRWHLMMMMRAWL